MGYQAYFEYKPIEDAFARIIVNQGDMAARVILNESVPDENKKFINVRKSAKHEAIHLLVHRLVDAGCRRYVNKDEIADAEEELVNRLEDLIQ
jgi:hypothetical protein